MGRLAAAICVLGAVWFGFGASAAAATRPPANDNFAKAQTVVAPLSNVYAETAGATVEPGEPDPRGGTGASVWFDWTAERSGGAEFSACYGFEFEAIVTVYSGEALDALTPVPRILGNRDCEYGFKALAGVTYRVQVDGEAGLHGVSESTGEAELGLHRFPFNDDFEAAVDLGSGTSLGWSSEWGNRGATKQLGEPDHDGDPGGSSVWFTWTAPTTGEVQITACAATFAPLLVAYIGTDVAALTPVAAAAGEPGAGCGLGPSAGGQLNFQTVAGTRYDLAVDGRAGASGTFQLSLAMDDRTRQALRGEPQPTGPPPLPKPKAIVARHVDQARRSVVFNLHSAESGAQFRCRLDRRRFAPCGAKVTYRHLTTGPHVFRALAVGPTGATGVPAKVSFAIRRSG